MKKVIKYIAIVSILMLSVQGYCQQEPLYTRYINNFSIINPAYAGSQGQFIATANVRSQWVGEAGGPTTGTFSIHGPTNNNVGIGLSVVHDNVFVLDETDIFVDFSYSIKMSESAKLAFGLKAGGSFLNVDLLSLDMGDDPNFNENINGFKPNVGAGAYYYTDRFFASVSAVNILKNEFFDKNDKSTLSQSTVVYNDMIFYLSSGYTFDLGEVFKLNPSFLSRFIGGSPLSTDLSVNLVWNDRIEFGVSHRFNESVSGLFQIRVSDFLKVGYSYDALTNNLSNYNNGSHEISLVFNFGKEK